MSEPSSTPEHPHDRARVRGQLERFRQRWASRIGAERQQGQEFLRQLLACYGRSLEGEDVAFEVPLTAEGGARGYADLLIEGLVLVEMKSAAKADTLEEDLDQARRYWEAAGRVARGGRSPRFVVLCV